MTAINWLATQLAWEQRLVELRSQDRPAQRNARALAPEARHSRKAA